MDELTGETVIVRASVWGVVVPLAAVDAIAVAVAMRIGDPGFRFIAMLMGVVAALVIALIGWVQSKRRVSFDRSGVAGENLLNSWSLRRDDIAGWRRVPAGRYLYRIQLTSRDGRNYQVDESPEAKRWVKGLTNLDQAEQAVLDGLIAADARLGATPQARRRSVQLVTIMFCALFVLDLVLALAAGFLDPPPQLAIVIVAGPILATLVALWLRVRSPPQIADPTPRATPIQDLVPLGAVFGLIDAPLMLFLFNCRIEGWKDLILPGLLIGALLLVVVVVVEGWPAAASGSISGPLFGAASVLVFGVGFLATLDVAMDLSPPSVLEREVLGMRVSHGRYTSYWLAVAPWGERPGARDESVSRRLYGQLQTGGPVCIVAHPGALQAAWHTLRPCR